MGALAVSITPATRTDHEAVWELAQETDTDWAYLLWCADYRRNAVVVTVNGHAAGFAIANPAKRGAPEVVALGIAPKYRRFGLRESLLKALGAQPDARPTGAA